MGGIRILENMLDSVKNITILCFCQDENICHRLIIKELLEKDEYECISI